MKEQESWMDARPGVKFKCQAWLRVVKQVQKEREEEELM